MAKFLGSCVKRKLGRYIQTGKALSFMEHRAEKHSALRAALNVGIVELEEGKGLSYSSEQLKRELLK